MDNGFAEGYAVGQGNMNNGAGAWGYGGEWLWIIVLFALFGWGGCGNGFGGNGGGGQQVGYELGKVATTNDVASGFNNSAVLSSLNDLKLGQAGVQQTLCQGFSGVNASIMQNGYETRGAISDLGYRLQDCCCQTQRAIDGVNYNKTVIKDDTNYDEATHVIKILSSDESGGNTAGFIPSEWGRKGFELNNNQSASYYQIKLSIIPPFDSGEGMSVQGTNLIMEATTGSGTYLDTACTLDNGERAIYVTQGIYDNKWGLFFGSNQTKKELETSDYSLIENTNLYKPNVIKAQAPNLTYNPKLNSQNFKELIITAANGDEFTYDIQKISAYEASFLYSEPIQPEITRYYMRLNPTGLYLEGTEENYTGLVGSTDNGLAFTTDQYAAFLANNKNFFMQSNLKIGIGAVKSTAGVISQAASGKIAGAVGSGLSAGLDIAQSLIDRSMTIDNMRSAPDQMKNANGNVLFNMFATDLGLYVEKYSALDGDLKTANDFINLYGFSFDSIANVKDYVHIRKYHNYVKAQLQGITGNISNTARDDLRQRFANGIRFWNQDEITYQYENYELWLED